jgi:hypothetical protein
MTKDQPSMIGTLDQPNGPLEPPASIFHIR